MSERLDLPGKILICERDSCTESRARTPLERTTADADRILATGVTLLVGDSIMIGQAADLISLLSGKTTVQGPVANAQTSTFTLSNISAWIAAASNPNVIIWNNGIWDALLSGGTTLSVYEANLRSIAALCLAQTSDVFFLETTDIPEDNTTHEVGKEVALSNIARSVLPDLGVVFVDGSRKYGKDNDHLFRPHLDNIVGDLHFNAVGYEQLARHNITNIFNNVDVIN